jgi:hypothetical protein
MVAVGNRFFAWEVLRTQQVTVWPAIIRSVTICEAINPEAPVTKTFIVYPQMNHFKRIPKKHLKR